MWIGDSWKGRRRDVDGVWVGSERQGVVEGWEEVSVMEGTALDGRKVFVSHEGIIITLSLSLPLRALIFP